MWLCVSSAWVASLGLNELLRFEAELHTEGSVPGALGPCSPRSADGPMIIISRPLSYLTTSSRTANSCFTRFTASVPWTAIFLLVLYFVHNINLYRDPAPGSIHLCLTAGKVSRWEFCSFFPLLFIPFNCVDSLRVRVWTFIVSSPQTDVIVFNWEKLFELTFVSANGLIQVWALYAFSLKISALSGWKWSKTVFAASMFCLDRLKWCNDIKWCQKNSSQVLCRQHSIITILLLLLYQQQQI